VSNGSEYEISSYQNVNYSYKDDEQLIGVTSGDNTYSLAYDAPGRCLKRTLNGVGTYYIYDGEKPIIEYNSAGTLVGRNLYGKWIDEPSEWATARWTVKSVREAGEASGRERVKF
jgi:YD repeat-containing protein